MKHLASWTQESTTEESLHLLSKLALSHAYEGGLQGQAIASLIAKADWYGVCDFKLDYLADQVEQLKNCRQALAFFTKFKTLPLVHPSTGERVDPLAAAIEVFEDCEEQCRETNALFQSVAQGSASFEPWVASALFSARQKIAAVLGEVPKLEDIKLRHGPGATTLTKKSAANASEKFGAPISCSEDLLPYASSILAEMPHLVSLKSHGSYCRVDTGEECDLISVELTTDRLNFVTKNAKIHRGILVGSSLAMMVQLGYGEYMSDQLLRFGIDLHDQSLNKALARKGSLDGSLATLDLKSASDTISLELVYELLPIDWVITLGYSRSSKIAYGQKVYNLEKFSSMGNGYTFPLESLIFWALASSVSEGGLVSVYGDDIIVETAYAERVSRLLNVVGFQLNQEKSFSSGPFRESCGGDYYRGIDIRPIYQSNLVSPMELFRLHNFYVRDGQLDRAKVVKDHINEGLLIYGPEGFGDGHLLGDWLPVRHKRALTHGYGGVLFDTFKLVARHDKRALRPGDRVLPVYSIYLREKGGGGSPPMQAYENAMSFAAFTRFQSCFRGAVASEPIPERVSPVDGETYKVLSYPGTDGYKRVSIYTFDTGVTSRVSPHRPDFVCRNQFKAFGPWLDRKSLIK